MRNLASAYDTDVPYLQLTQVITFIAAGTFEHLGPVMEILGPSLASVGITFKLLLQRGFESVFILNTFLDAWRLMDRSRILCVAKSNIMTGWWKGLVVGLVGGTV